MLRQALSLSHGGRHVIIASLLLTTLSTAAPAASVLTVCTEGSPDTFDIAQSELAIASDAVGYPVYDQLLALAPGTTRIVPSLAERHEIAADGLSVTLHLRRGVKFHTTPGFTPTRDLSAEDVRFSLERMAARDGPWREAAKKGFPVFVSTGMSDVLAGVDVLGPHTVRLRLKRPFAPFLGMLARTFTGSVYSAEYAQQLLAAGRPAQLETLPVGTGPFVFRSYRKDASIRLDAHPAYWAGRPKVDQLVFAITPDPQVRVQRLKAGECLVATYMKPEAAQALEGSAAGLAGGPALFIGFLALNVKRPFTSDARFRRALWLALDKKTLVRSVYAGRGDASASFLPPAQWGVDRTLAERFDPAEARAQVQASGYDGRELQLFVRVGGGIDSRRAAELMQADWARIGVAVRVRQFEIGEMLQRAGRGEHDLALLGWIGNGDPDDFLAPNLACASIEAGVNKSHWCDRAFDALLEQARGSFDVAQRTAMYAPLQRRVWEEVPVIPLVAPHYFTGVNRKVQGFVASPTTNVDFRDVSLR